MSLDFIGLDSNQNKKVFRVAGATLGQGVPLGTWCSFEKDVAPSSNWLRAGTTFDSNTYPALALYLGTNKVPERYATYKDTRVFMDLNNPNSSLNGTSITIPNASHVTSMEALGTTRTNQQETAILAVDLTTATSLVFGFGGGGYTTTLSGTYDATSDTWTIANATGRGLFVNYDELGAEETRHPLFIKATSIASDTDQQAILAQIQAYNTYSTEETLTGETWIENGVEKPIYRRCYFGLNIPFTNQENWQSLGITAPLNVDSIKKGICYGTDVNAPYSAHDIPFCNCLVAIGNNNTLFRWNTLNAGVIHSVVIEYTKTND